jgi:hypothetical protein
MKKTMDKILIAMIIISILAGSIALIQRINAESSNDHVELFIDYFEVNELARQSDHDVQWWLAAFRELGATHVVLQEETFGLLRQAKQPMRVEVGQDILKEWNWQEFVPPVLVRYHETVGIEDYDTIVMTEEDDLYAQIAAGIRSRYEEDRYTLQNDDEGSIIILHGTLEDSVYHPPADLIDFEGNNYFRELRLHSSQLSRVGLGFDQEKIDVIQAAGLRVMPRPTSYSDWGGETYLRAYLDDIIRMDMIPHILFTGGKQLPGYEDDSLYLLQEFMQEHGVKIGLMETAFQREHIDQDGLDELTVQLDYMAVRVFNVWPFVQERYQFYNYEGAEEIENTLYRAVTERNIRMIYFKPFKESQTVYVTDFEEYERIFQRFEERIAKHGLQLGSASTLPPNQPGIFLQMLMVIGISAAGILFVKKLLPIPSVWLWALMAALTFPQLALFMIRPGLAEKLAALAAAIIYPSLAMWLFCRHTWVWMTNHERFTYFQAFKCGLILLLKVSLISFIGAIMVAAMLSDVRYLLEIDIFRGVKISQLIPMVSYGFAFLYFFGYLRPHEKLHNPGIRPNELKSLLMEDIKLLYLMVFGFLLVAGYIYLARTGHEGNLQPMEIEMVIRNFLEETLLVRPRTKEFTVAFPALFLGAYLASLRFKSLIFLSGLAAVIGQTSIVNTFSHLRTPFIVSVIRTAYSLVAGIGFSAVYLLLLILIVAAIEQWGRKIWMMMEKAG